MFGVSSKKLREAEFKLDGALSQSEAKEKRTSVPFQPKSFPVNGEYPLENILENLKFYAKFILLVLQHLIIINPLATD